ncbi:50S ribosomal protein L10 [Candidatus Marinamargulisbacteria bacterium SCGC AG-333-B06]|nr:50S ribosomal protein L10 [Candidatus Marinamargulisbacteria bacterium SCGC AG-333-B06]
MSSLDTKKEIVKNIEAEFSNSEAIIISDYSGLKVSDITDLRQQLFKEGFYVKVLRNRLTKRAFDNNKYDYPAELLTGQNIVFKSDDNIVGLSKLLVSYQKEYESFEIKGGLLEGNYIDNKQISKLAKLPSKEELIAKTVGLIKGPLTGLVATLSSPVNGFINVLNNIKNNK